MISYDGDELGGPLDLFMGLPVHPLVVHAAVVLVPLVAFSALAMSYWPSFSRKIWQANSHSRGGRSTLTLSCQVERRTI